MKTRILWAVAAVAMVTGCTEMRKNMGASNENDQNVLTGGPVTGTRLSDLPEEARRTLRDRVPTAEVADIDKQTLNGQIVYKISFAEPGKNPSIFITPDGKVVQSSKSLGQ